MNLETPAARLARIVVATACAMALSGCWPFGHNEPTPQQQYLDALSRGQGAQAAQIWQNMSPEDREHWAHNEGFTPEQSPDDIKKLIEQHYAHEQGTDSENGETIENVMPDLGGSLQDLPARAGETPPAPPSDNSN